MRFCRVKGFEMWAIGGHYLDGPKEQMRTAFRRDAAWCETGLIYLRCIATFPLVRVLVVVVFGQASQGRNREDHHMSTLTHSDLAQFTGTEQWYRHSLCRNITYTDGVKYLAETAGAYWLVDKVATNQLQPKIKAEEFQSWKLKVGHNNTAVLTCDDGNGNIVHSEDITFTDFPLDEIDLWVEGGVILLPSEH